MRRASLALIVVAACTAPASHTAAPVAPVAPVASAPAPISIPKASGAGRIETHHFHSAALGVDKDYLVYLPGGYGADPAARWPVVYYLNGLGGDETNWASLGDLGAAADKLHLAAIVVMPDGDDGFYTNAVTPRDYDACMKDGTGLFMPGEDPAKTCVRTPRYEDYIVQDLIAHVDATYATIADRRGRGIAGDSMGGFGALQLAMRHLDLFSAAASHSGVDALLYVGPHPYEPGKAVLLDDVAQWGRTVPPIGVWVRAIFGPDRASWEAHDPAALAAHLAPGQLALYLDCGTEDIFLLNDAAAYLHDVLTARGIAHTYYIGPGRHDFDFWRERVGHSLAFFAAHFAGQPAPVEAPAAPATPAAAGDYGVTVTRIVAGAGIRDDIADSYASGLTAPTALCADTSHPAAQVRELAVGLTDTGALGEVRVLGDGAPDAFDGCLRAIEPSPTESVSYVYVALSIVPPGHADLAAPPAPDASQDLDEICHAADRAGVKAGDPDAATRLARYVSTHVRHPDVLALLHAMAASAPAQKQALLRAALKRSKIATCPFLERR